MEHSSTSPRNPASRVPVGSLACAIGDYNNDGLDDLFLTYYDQNVLFRNNGDGSFTDVTREAGLLLPSAAMEHWLHFCRLRSRRPPRSLLQHLRRPGHGRENAHRLRLERNSRALWSTRASQGPMLFVSQRWSRPFHRCQQRGWRGPGRAYGFTAVAADFDDDGWPDIYVACDSTPSFYFRNRHDGTFAEEGLERGVALSEDGAEQAGMGLGIGDYKLDGTLGILKTHFADDTSVLYENNGKGEFTDVTLKAGLGVETRYVCWGAGIVDLDNDGLPDLFIAAGQVFPGAGKESAAVSLQESADRVPQSGRRAGSRNCSTKPDRRSPPRTPAAGVRSATSTTMATSTS